MDVKVINFTDRPCLTISLAAGTSYGKRDKSLKRIKHCFNNGHMSVFEHASVTFYISGISRACSHQLVRHRLASFVQKSQRYTKVDGDDWYVTPPTLSDTNKIRFKNCMTTYKAYYDQALSEGIKPEDARYFLPEATKTDIMMTMNCRELFHFFDLRLDEHAQWEIRELAQEIKDLLSKEEDYYADGWATLIDLYDGKDICEE